MQTADLILIVNQQLDETHNDDEIIRYFNLCLMDLSSIRTAFDEEPFQMLTDRNSVPELESHFRDLLIDYAISQLQFKEEDYDERPDRINRYLQRKREYLQFLSRQTTAQPITDVYGISEVEDNG